MDGPRVGIPDKTLMLYSALSAVKVVGCVPTDILFSDDVHTLHMFVPTLLDIMYNN